MRRREVSGPVVPEKLVRFVAEEWPDMLLWEAWNAWRAERLAYAKEYPDGPLGDVVDVLRGHRAARRLLPPDRECPGWRDGPAG